MSQVKDAAYGVVIAIVLVIGGVGSTAAYHWGAASRDGEIGKLEAKVKAHEKAVAAAIAKAKEDAALLQGRIDVVTENYKLVASHRTIETKEVIKYVTRTVPRNRLCLDAGPVRVLNALREPAAANPDSLDPRSVAETLGAPAGNQGTAAPDFAGGISAQGIALWSAISIKEYEDLRAKHDALADILEHHPAVKVTK